MAAETLTQHDRQSLEAELSRLGHKPIHARKILRAFWAANGQPDPDSLPGTIGLRAWLAPLLAARLSSLRHTHTSDDGTQKLLVGFEAGGAVESVLMPSHRPDRAACCLSSQIGCAMGCDFCASTKSGFDRNLSAGEIVEQYLHLRRAATSLDRRITSLVFMGMGEPLHNLDNVLRAIRIIGHADTGNLGWRQITLSTVGIVPGIHKLAQSGLNIHLALSLHGPDDATRGQIIPSNRRYPVHEIISAAKSYYDQTGRIVTIEYTLIAGINDSDDHATRLANLIEGFRAHVNLIPYNPIGPGVSGTVYVKPSRNRVLSFKSILDDRQVVTHVRVTRGDDVSAACGQLRQTLLTP